MADLTADFEGGVDTDPVGAGQGEASATAWDSVYGGGATVEYDDTHVAHGTLAAKMIQSGQQNLVWSTAWGTQTDTYGRAYFYFTSYDAYMAQVNVVWRDSTTTVARINFDATGHPQITNASAYTQTMATAVTLNQWIRLEWHVVHSATVGAMEIKLFNNAASTTADETEAFSGTNTGAQSTSIWFGHEPEAAHFSGYTYWMDDIVANATSYPGPAIYTSWFGTRDTSGTNEETPGNNYIIVSPFTLTENALVNELRIFCRGTFGSPLMRGVIYTDSSDLPDVLMGVTDEVAITNGVLAWNQLPFPTPVSLPAGDYWLGFNYDPGTIGHRFQNAVGDGRFFKSDAYSASPDNPYGTASGGDAKITTIYATYEYEPSDPYRDAVLTDSPWLYWRLNETSGTTVVDSSGNGRTGTSGGDVDQSPLITVGASQFFNDSTDYAISNSAIFNSSDATIEVWFDYDGTPAPSLNYLFVAGCAEGDGGATGDKDLGIDDAGHAAFYWYGPPGLYLEGSTVLSAGTHHLVATVDGSGVKLYVDGVQDGTDASTSSYAGYSNPNVLVGGNGGPMAFQVAGRRDEFALYTTALSAARVLAHYEAGVGGVDELTTLVARHGIGLGRW